MDDNRDSMPVADESDRQIEPDIRSVRRGAWRFVTLGIAAIALLTALIVVLMKPKPAPVVSIVETQVAPTVSILDASWTVDAQGKYTIAGRIENQSGGPIRSVTVRVMFFDESRAQIATEPSMVDLPESLPPGASHPFSVTGQHDARYKAADYRVESWN
ncbi:MAG: hypothetical protein IT350_03510 [Deltaproteobacteria bacterium]|nr:hypothetical protein [Deltaproteobacteria bacterium]